MCSLTGLPIKIFCSLLMLCQLSVANEIVYLSPDAELARNHYNYRLLHLSLEETVADFGPYELIYTVKPMVSDRAFLKLQSDEKGYVISSTFKAHLYDKMEIIPFPIYKGLGSYRILVASSDQLASFEHIISIEQLKAFRFGQGRDWSTAKILRDNGFKLVYSDLAEIPNTFPNMLRAGRFDIYMRGVHEFVEERLLYGSSSGLAMIEDLAAYTYLPTYFHVAKHENNLGKRVYQGLLRLDKKGEVENLLKRHYSEALGLVGEMRRKVIYIENTNLKPGMYQRDKPYLLPLKHKENFAPVE